MSEVTDPVPLQLAHAHPGCPACAQEAAVQARMRRALEEIEAHHLQANAQAGRPPWRSRTLQLARAGLGRGG